MVLFLIWAEKPSPPNLRYAGLQICQETHTQDPNRDCCSQHHLQRESEGEQGLRIFRTKEEVVHKEYCVQHFWAQNNLKKKDSKEKNLKEDLHA